MRPRDPSDLSAGELRALVAERGATLGRAFLDRIEADGRASVAPVAARLRRLLGLRRRETSRRTRMLALERRHWREGVMLVAGVDEVGMGPLAGPVVAAAVILDPDRPVREADDSKKLDRATRERLAEEINRDATAIGLGIASVEDIEREDVYRAGLLAMRRAVLALVPQPQRLLVDARTIPDLDVPQEAHVKGDTLSCSIASASIVAKVHRDALMTQLAAEHPGYGFERHAGYSTPEHWDALRRLGPCAAHRTTWAAVTDAGTRSETFNDLRAMLRGAGDCLEPWRASVSARLASLTPDEVHRLDELARRRGGRKSARRDDAGLPFA